MGEGHTYAWIAVFILFLIIDGILYSFEAAISGVNENDIDERAEEGNKKAKKLKRLIDEPARFSDTFDIVIFITNVIAGVYIAASAGSYISSHTAITSSWAPVIASTVMLLILIVFGVLIPKKCGKRSADKTAYTLVNIAGAIIVVFTPITIAAAFIARLIIRIFGIKPDENNDNVTEQEIITMVNEGQEQGVLEESEAEMITNIFELGDKHSGDIMTHRSSIVALDCHMTLEDVIQQQLDGNYSRFPVYDENIDNIVGTLHIRDAIILYRNIPNKKKQIHNVKGLLRAPFLVPDTRDIDDLLKEMQAKKVHMGIVIDEYGQTAGIITMEDIIEEIVGSILDEYDEEEEVIEQNEDDSYVVDGLTELEDLNKLLGIDIESDEYETLNGFLISRLDRIPDEDTIEDVVDFGYRFKILEVSGNVIRRVEITREPEKEADTDGADNQTEQ